MTEKSERIMEVVANYKPVSRETEDTLVRLNKLVEYLTGTHDAWVDFDAETNVWSVNTDTDVHTFEPGTGEPEMTVWIVREFTEDIPW